MIAYVLACADTARGDTGPDPWGSPVTSATGRMTGSRLDNPQINHRQSVRVIGQKEKVRKKVMERETDKDWDFTNTRLEIQAI